MRGDGTAQVNEFIFEGFSQAGLSREQREISAEIYAVPEKVNLLT